MSAVTEARSLPEGWPAVASECRLSYEGGAAIVWLAGDQDAATAPTLCEVVADVLATDDTDLVVDLRRVTFLDASTVGALLRGRRLFLDRDRRMTVRYPSAFASRVLDLCGLDDVLAVVPLRPLA